MNLYFKKGLADKYDSPSQKIRVLTEDWVSNYIFCPSCSKGVKNYDNNKPVADFYCQYCKEDFELKSKKDNIGSKIVNGAYKTMISRLLERNNPNFFLLTYDMKRFEVTNFFIIPKYLFIPEIIEKRNPLSKTARRAGWVGCNILLTNIPNSGKIFYIKNRIIENKNNVLENWRKTLFLKEQKNEELKGWTLDVMICIDKIIKKEFSLSELYYFEEELSIRHPNNKHIKDKIRQQLQFLRDKNYIEFLGKGEYRLI